MTFSFADRAKEITTSTGTGALTTDYASGGYQGLPSYGDFYYCIVHAAYDEWEVGIGNASGGDLARTTVLDSSNGGSLVDFSVGTKEVFCTSPALLARNASAVKPTGSASDTTTDNTPTPITVQLVPLPPEVGGIRFLFVRYAVVAHTTAGGGEMKAWEGTLIYADGDGATDTPVVIYDPDITGWSIAADFSGGDIVFTVTGHATNPTTWKVTASVDVSQEIGV